MPVGYVGSGGPLCELGYRKSGGTGKAGVGAEAGLPQLLRRPLPEVGSEGTDSLTLFSGVHVGPNYRSPWTSVGGEKLP